MMPFFGQGVNISIFLYCTFTRKQQQQQHHHHHHHHQVTITRKSSPVFLVMITAGTHSQIPPLYHLLPGPAGTASKWKGIHCSSLQPHLPSYVNQVNILILSGSGSWLQGFSLMPSSLHLYLLSPVPLLLCAPQSPICILPYYKYTCLGITILLSTSS